MQISESFLKNENNNTWTLTNTRYMYFYDYWSRPALQSPKCASACIILISIFTIQIIAIAFGLIILLSAYSKLKMLLFLGTLITLDLLYLFFMQDFRFDTTPHIGFFLSLASTALFAESMARSKKLNNSPKNTTEHNTLNNKLKRLSSRPVYAFQTLSPHTSARSKSIPLPTNTLPNLNEAAEPVTVTVPRWT